MIRTRTLQLYSLHHQACTGCQGPFQGAVPARTDWSGAASALLALPFQSHSPPLCTRLKVRGPRPRDPGQQALGAHGRALAAAPPRTRAFLLARACACLLARSCAPACPVPALRHPPPQQRALCVRAHRVLGLNPSAVGLTPHEWVTAHGRGSGVGFYKKQMDLCG